MDAKLKAEWLKALRSGEYRQARYGIGSTRTKCLCCLGVGAYVANPSIKLVSTDDAVEELSAHGLRGWRSGEYADAIQKLIEMNDDDGHTFPEIADYIETNL